VKPPSGRRRRAATAMVAALLAVLASCAPVEAEQEAHVIAFLHAVPGAATPMPAVLAQLDDLGFVDGRNLVVLSGDPDDAYPDPAEARDAVRRWVDDGAELIIALSSASAAIAHEAAPRVPVLFLSNDPLATGLVRDEDTPEGMLTGVTFRVPADRTLDLARRMLGEEAVIGLAQPVDDPAGDANRDAVLAAAGDLGIRVVTATFRDGADVAEAVAELADAGVDALLLSTSPTATRALTETEEAASAHGLPVIANVSIAARAVMTLFPDGEELGRQMGRQAARLLAGSSPAAVPVEDPRRFVLVINAGEAAALGIDLPPDLLREADRVVR
jgi:putative tryptophan/tyrosine transport system substrate-binding protein